MELHMAATWNQWVHCPHFDAATNYENESRAGKAAIEDVRSGAVASRNVLSFGAATAQHDRLLPALRQTLRYTRARLL
jgi:hypothetical protein